MAPALFLLAFGVSPATIAARQPQGPLDPEVIRGVIQSHVAEVRKCYETELAKTPAVFGELLVRFTIDASGAVSEASLEESTTENAAVESCTLAAVRRWRYPKPAGGGDVVVTYPFVLTPGDSPTFPIYDSDRTGPINVTAVGGRLVVHTTTDAQGISANGLIAVTASGLLLFDTGWSDAQTEVILRWGEQRFKRPWIGAVITHDHQDRDGGLGALQRRQIPVAALDLTVAKLAKRGVRGVATLFTASAGTFKDPRGFEALYPGPGHTSDNIVVGFEGALFVGCMVKSTEASDVGFTGDADLAHWPQAVRRVIEWSKKYGAVPIVPGHGPVDSTTLAFQHTLDLLAARDKQ